MNAPPNLKQRCDAVRFISAQKSSTPFKCLAFQAAWPIHTLIYQSLAFHPGVPISKSFGLFHDNTRQSFHGNGEDSKYFLHWQ
jgi:hypothetical protein